MRQLIPATKRSFPGVGFAAIVTMSILSACSGSNDDLPSGNPDVEAGVADVADGATTDVGTPTPMDAGADVEGGATTLCGSTRCRTDQVCNAVTSLCEYSCTGKQVPGDYATLAAAVQALANDDAVICYHGPTPTPTTTLDISISKNLTIVGVADKEKTEDLHIVTGSTGSLSLKGLEPLAIRAEGGTVLTVSNSRLAVFILESTQTGDVLIDGSEARGVASLHPAANTTVTVQNSYIQNEIGVGSTVGSTATYRILYNTFSSAGLYIGGADTKVDVIGNIFVKAKGVALMAEAIGAGSNFKNNLFFENKADFGGVAAAGPGDVMADPLFDTSKPPGLKVGSPARGAGALGTAPATDFYGIPRSTPPDLGAVQSQ